MLIQQTVATISKTFVPVIAFGAAPDLGVDPDLVGVFVAITAGAGIATTLGCGNFIRRFGALRMSQVGSVVTALGLFLVASQLLWAFPFAAVLIGCGVTLSTPASSHILARYAPARHAPLIFSIKQTGVPAGVMLTGLVVPVLVALVAWYGAAMVTGVACLVLAVALQPLRERFDDDRDPSQRLAFADIRHTLGAVLGRPQMRVLAFATFTFVGIQSVFTAFSVNYLQEVLGYGLETAGKVLATAMAVAIPARILWGWIAGNVMPSRIVLAVLGFAMGGGIIAFGFTDPGWGAAAVAACAVAVTATAVSFHGVLLAEVARLSSADQVGRMTGGVLAFASAATTVYPLIFTLILTVSGKGGYLIGFALTAIPAVFVSAILIRQRPSLEKPDVSAANRSRTGHVRTPGDIDG